MPVPILKTPITFTRTITVEPTFSVMEFTEDKLILNANINPLDLLEKGFPEEVLEGIKDTLRGYLTLRIGVSRENLDIVSFRQTYVVIPKSKDLKFDTKTLEEDMKNGEMCVYNVNLYRSKKE